MVLLWVWSVVPASAASIAVFPLQELAQERNEVNLPLTRLLTEQLVADGNELIALNKVMAFMAHNRIRTLGHLESYYISRVRSDLGAAFILLGTVSQRREKPEPTLGLTLNLLRTSDGQTVWTYVDSLSRSDERRLLGINEPQTGAELSPLLLRALSERWPWHIINEAQQVGSINLDLAQLEPRNVRPGENVYSKVRLRAVWPAGQGPQVFFRADNQLYPATLAADGRTWEGRWVAGSEDGNYPVMLLLEWPLYGRTESTLLGSYVVDGKPPLFEIELRGAQELDGRAIFSREIIILPRLLVRKPLSHWRLSFYSEDGTEIGAMQEEGQLPERLIWAGRSNFGVEEDGFFRFDLEVWDLAGNTAKVEQSLEMNRSRPNVVMAIDTSSTGTFVNLTQEGKVPLEYWRMEMWTREGKILARQEGYELPVDIDLAMEGATLSDDIQGFVFSQDVLGNRVRRTIGELLPNLGKVVEEKAEEVPDSVKWVEEF